jgi:hypothetical protein
MLHLKIDRSDGTSNLRVYEYEHEMPKYGEISRA